MGLFLLIFYFFSAQATVFLPEEIISAFAKQNANAKHNKKHGPNNSPRAAGNVAQIFQ